MLVGRTFSYSDTQRYRVGPELPAAAGQPGQGRPVAHQPARRADGLRRRPGAGAEPARQLRAVDHSAGCGRRAVPDARRAGPGDHGRLTRKRIPRTERLHAGRPALPAVGAVGAGRPGRQPGRRPARQCDRPIQERMVWHLFMAEDELGQRVGEGLGISADDVRGLEPLQTQTLTEEELQRAAQPRQERPARRQRPDHDALRAQRARGPRAVAPPARATGPPQPRLRGPCSRRLSRGGACGPGRRGTARTPRRSPRRWAPRRSCRAGRCPRGRR